MKLDKPVEIQCQCGHKIITQSRKDWCEKCGRPVFYDSKDARKHKLNQLYILGAVGVVISSVIYFFIELIVKPFFG